MAGKLISAIDIKKLWYCDPAEVSGAVTSESLAALLKKATPVTNIHQDTWQIEEAEPSQDSYRNQLTGSIYRQGRKTMGDITVNFTIGQYDYSLKASLMGGTATENGWERARGAVYIRKAIIALTTDDVYIVYPYCNVSVREANTDGALGLSVTATVMEPQDEAVSTEYWLDATTVDDAE